MSPIGRIFIVLNLVLAGCFVGFAGTFLQRHTDYKERYDLAQADFEKKEATLTKQVESITAQNRQSQRDVDSLKERLGAAESKNGDLSRENVRLSEQLTKLAADIQKMQADYSTVAQQIQTATQESKDAYTRAMEATAAKDQANSAREDAETKLSDAQRQIEQLNTRISEQVGEIAGLNQTINEKDVLLSVVQQRAPGVLAFAQPDLAGNVTHVGPQGNILTIEVKSNPANADLKKGYRFAVSRGDTYKGEALITDIKDNFAFCRMTKKVDGTSIQVGDAAATNLGY